MSVKSAQLPSLANCSRMNGSCQSVGVSEVAAEARLRLVAARSGSTTRPRSARPAAGRCEQLGQRRDDEQHREDPQRRRSPAGCAGSAPTRAGWATATCPARRAARATAARRGGPRGRRRHLPRRPELHPRIDHDVQQVGHELHDQADQREEVQRARARPDSRAARSTRSTAGPARRARTASRSAASRRRTRRRRRPETRSRAGSARCGTRACTAPVASRRPLARATSTYCLRISSTNVFLVSIVTTAKLPIA